MANTQLNRILTGPAAALILVAVLLVALFLLTDAAQRARGYGQLYSALLVVNAIGTVALVALIATNLTRLIRQFRAGVLGSRLTLRLLAIYALLAVVPLSVVYYFSVQFLSKGIDSYFDVRVERALDDALMVGRTSLDALQASLLDAASEDASRVAEANTNLELIRLLDELREQADYNEISLFTQAGRIIASSNLDPTSLLPTTPKDAALAAVKKGEKHASIEPTDDGANQLALAAVPVYTRDVSEPARVLQVIKSLPLRYTKLDQSVETASAEYRRLKYLRGPLKFNFVLTLSLITLMTALIALWAAFFSARHLVAPLRDLAEGTRAVAAGDYQKQLPVTSSDELGVLVQSFNDMTRQVHQAQSQVQKSQIETELQRTWLETVLAHLSSGVMSFDRRRNLLTINEAAVNILMLDDVRLAGFNVQQLAQKYPHIEPLMLAIGEGLRANLIGWSTELTLQGRRGRQTLTCQVTRLPATSRGGGYVVVFDDITELIRAQRDAAWGEVARRLAHEIKNPLTPIQLSAERIRRKYLHRFEDEKDRKTLDRATRTIAQQVESMKQMVNAFSNYAQPMHMRTASIDFNRLVQDVVELHRQNDERITVALQLDPQLPKVEADADRLRQVLNNLILNSQDALQNVSDARMSIATRALGRDDTTFVELTVSDNGPGFNTEIIDRVFEPYVTSKEKGTGLGLAIVKRIVEEHGGNLWPENLAGGGARLTIQLPVRLALDNTSEQATSSQTTSAQATATGDTAPANNVATAIKTAATTTATPIKTSVNH